MTKNEVEQTTPSASTNSGQSMSVEEEIRSLFMLVAQMKHERKYALALRILVDNKQKLMLDPNNYFILEAKIKSKLHQPEEALASISQYGQYTKESGSTTPIIARTTKAYILILLEHYTEAIALLSSIPDEKKNDCAYACLIKCLLEFDRLDAANARFNEFMQKSNNVRKMYPEICKHFANFYQKNMQKNKAYEWLDKILYPDSDSINSEDIEFLESAAEISIFFNDYRRLLSIINALIKTEPKYQKIRLLFLAKYHFYNGQDIKRAHALIYQYVNLQPGEEWDEKALRCITQCYERLGWHQYAAHYHKLGLKTISDSFFIRRNAKRHAEEHPHYYLPKPIGLNFFSESAPYTRTHFFGVIQSSAQSAIPPQPLPSQTYYANTQSQQQPPVQSRSYPNLQYRPQPRVSSQPYGANNPNRLFTNSSNSAIGNDSEDIQHTNSMPKIEDYK